MLYKKMFNRKTLIPGLLTVVAFGIFVINNLSKVSAAPTIVSDAQTTKAVNAAQAFLATLNASQKKAALFAFTDAAQRVRWSNFPAGAVPRSGVRWGDMNTAQRAALMNLLSQVLSSDGVQSVKDQMAADDVVNARDATQGSPPPGGKRTPPPGGPPKGGPAGGPPPGGQDNGRPPVSFGSNYYYVSFVGTPSGTSAWMLQFGGHHLAINATVVGSNITLSPSLTGGQPVNPSKDSKGIAFVSVEAKAAFAMLNSLTAAQKTKAVKGTQPIELVLGPGQDGKTLQPEGLAGSAMSTAQKTQFLALIKSRLSLLNNDDLAVKMGQVQKDLDKTYFAWWGSTAAGKAAYYRITGPTVIIEFSPQSQDGDATDHAHNMYRDPTNEYGALWTTLK